MEMKGAACCSGCRSPLGAAKWSPQDFTLFLINYCHDLSANVREGPTLDNTCGESFVREYLSQCKESTKPYLLKAQIKIIIIICIVLHTNLWRICCTLVLSSVHFQTAPWNVSEILCPADTQDLSAPCEQVEGHSVQNLWGMNPIPVTIKISVQDASKCIFFPT